MTDGEDREAAFRRLLQDPVAYAAWAAGVRRQWEREHGVEWFHGYRDGREVWRPVRPAEDPMTPARFRMNPRRAEAYAAKLQAARTGTHPVRG